MEAICKVLQKLLKEPERATFSTRAFGRIACSPLILTQFCGLKKINNNKSDTKSTKAGIRLV